MANRFEKEIEKELEQVFPKSSDLRLVDVDLSGISYKVVGIKNINNDPLVNQVLDKQVLKNKVDINSKNCTDNIKEYSTVEIVETRNESITFEWAAGIEWGVTAKFDVTIPEVASVGGETTFKVDANVTETTQDSQSEVITYPSQTHIIPKCSELHSSVSIFRNDVKGEFLVEIVAEGELKYKVEEEDLIFDNIYEYTEQYYRKKEFKLNYHTKNNFLALGKDATFPAKCPSGSACNPLTHTVTVSLGERSRRGPSIGSQLKSSLEITDSNGGSLGDTFIITQNPGVSISITASILEIDTQPKYDDYGETTINNYFLPNLPTIRRLNIPIKVVTEGGDRILSSLFFQEVIIEVK